MSLIGWERFKKEAGRARPEAAAGHRDQAAGKGEPAAFPGLADGLPLPGLLPEPPRPARQPARRAGGLPAGAARHRARAPAAGEDRPGEFLPGPGVGKRPMAARTGRCRRRAPGLGAGAALDRRRAPIRRGPRRLPAPAPARNVQGGYRPGRPAAGDGHRPPLGGGRPRAPWPTPCAWPSSAAFAFAALDELFPDGGSELETLVRQKLDAARRRARRARAGAAGAAGDPPHRGGGLFSHRRRDRRFLPPAAHLLQPARLGRRLLRPFPAGHVADRPAARTGCCSSASSTACATTCPTSTSTSIRRGAARSSAGCSSATAGRAAFLSSHKFFGARSALYETARAFGFNPDEAHALTKPLPMFAEPRELSGRGPRGPRARLRGGRPARRRVPRALAARGRRGVRRRRHRPRPAADALARGISRSWPGTRTRSSACASSSWTCWECAASRSFPPWR